MFRDNPGLVPHLVEALFHLEVPRLIMENRAEAQAEETIPSLAHMFIRCGAVEAKREDLLRVMARLGLEPTEEQRARILACTDIATLDRWFDAAFSSKTAAVVMGDFNAKHNANAAVASSEGYYAFGDLVGAGFEQLVVDAGSLDCSTSLIGKNPGHPVMQWGDCYSQPYDNIFLRPPHPNPRQVVAAAPGLEELIQECVGGRHLGHCLRALHAVRDPANAPAQYASIDDAFPPFRRFVSDHGPVVTEITWQ